MPLEDDEINRLRLAALIDEYDSNESWIKDMRCNKWKREWKQNRFWKEKREYILQRLERLQSGQQKLDSKIDSNERRRQYDERRRSDKRN